MQTFTSSYVATCEEFNFKHIVVVAPVSVQTKWKYVQETHDIPIEFNLSYHSIRSSKGRQPSHGLLARRDYTTPMEVRRGFLSQTIEIDKVEFSCTTLFDEMIERGTLLIFDEIQNIKNITAQFSACQALIKRVVLDKGQKSKILCLSGSPIDKQEHAVALFRSLYVMRSDALASYNPGTTLTTPKGIAEISSFCRSLDEEKTDAVVKSWRASHDNRYSAYRLFQDVFKPHLSSHMPAPPNEMRADIRNGFYEIRDPKDKSMLDSGIEALQQAVGYDRSNDTVNFAHSSGAASMCQMTQALQFIESSKLSTLMRLAEDALSLDPNHKVVICVNYLDSIKTLVTLLSSHRPLVLNGSVPMINRARILKTFQDATSADRLLIGNLSVCSTGIDLDDKRGDKRRFAFVNPNYSSITLYQLGYRFLRIDSKSSPVIRIVYGKHNPEVKILNALARKGSVMKETTPDQVEQGVLFPGDYPTWSEDTCDGAEKDESV